FPVIEQYYSSILTIYDGVNLESPLIGSYHGLDNNVKIRSTGNSLFILAFNGPWPYGQGFNGTYEINETPGCLYQARSASGILKLEAGKYKASSDFFFCFWDLYAPAYQVITVKLSDIGDLTDCSQAYVKVYNVTFYRGYFGYAKYCGSNIPQFLRSYENTMSIEYFVNKTGPQPRLNGSYVVTDCNWKYGDACEHDCRCNRTYTQFCNNLNGNCECVSGMTGADCSVDIDECKINTTCHPALTCRNTFGSYECELEKTEPVGQFDCYYSHWGKTYQVSIKAPANQVVTLSVSDFGAFVRQNCDLDFSVFNGNSSNSQLGYYCGSKVPKLLRTTQNVMRLTTLNNYGLTACHAEYQTHSCPPFTYSAECKVSCKCLKETSVSCDSVYGTCVCKPGYTGRDCSQDIDECTFVKNCTQNSECINTPGSYICQCLRGYTYNTVTGLCEISQECSEQDRKRCSHTCYLINGRPQCGCPENLVLDDIEKINCVTPFYTPFGEVISYGLNDLDKKIEFNTKLPFGSKTISSAFINKGGVIYFDNNANVNPSIGNAHSSAVKLIAPLWGKYNLKKGIISYQLIENCRLSDFTIPTRSFAQTEILKRAAKDLKIYRPEMYDFEVNTVLVVTWQQLQLPKKTEELTFQAIYISGYEKKVLYGEVVPDDKESSFAMFIYQKGKDKWGDGHPASIGFTNGDTSHDIVKLFPHVLMKLGHHHPDSKFPPGVMMFSVGSVNSHEQKCKQYLCKHVHLKSSDTYLSQINELHKCPCSLDRLALQWDLYKRTDNYDCYALSPRAKLRLLPKNPRNKVTILTQNLTNRQNSELYFKRLVTLRSLHPEYYGTPEFYYGPESSTGYRWVYHLQGTQPFGVVVSIETTTTIVETFTAVPVAGWGEMYYVMALSMKFSVILMTNELENTILFKLKSEDKKFSLEIDGSFHRQGEMFTIRMKPYGTYAISHCWKDLADGFITGSQIRGARPFGAVSGSCGGSTQAKLCGSTEDDDISIESTVTPAAEMLLPTETAGTSFILFSVTGRLAPGFYIIMSVHSAPIKVSIARHPQSPEVDHFYLSQAGDWDTYKAQNTILRASGPVEVVYVQNSSCVTDRGGYQMDHSMMLMIPYQLFYHMYIASFPEADMRHYMVFVIQPHHFDTLHKLYSHNMEPFLGEPIAPPEKVQGINEGGHWSVYQFEVTKGRSVLIVSLRTRFGCYLHGASNESTYMHPAGFISSNINTEMCKKTLTTMKSGDLLDNDCDGYVDEEMFNEKDDDVRSTSDKAQLIDEDLGIFFVHPANFHVNVLNFNPNYSRFTTPALFEKNTSEIVVETMDKFSSWNEWHCIQRCRKIDAMIRTRQCIQPVVKERVCTSQKTEVKESECYPGLCPTECPDYQWGVNCRGSCTNCAQPCNKFTGVCDSCKPGFENPHKSCTTPSHGESRQPKLYLLFLLIPLAVIVLFLLQWKPTVPTEVIKSKSKKTKMVVPVVHIEVVKANSKDSIKSVTAVQTHVIKSKESIKSEMPVQIEATKSKESIKSVPVAQTEMKKSRESIKSVTAVHTEARKSKESIKFFQSRKNSASTVVSKVKSPSVANSVISKIKSMTSQATAKEDKSEPLSKATSRSGLKDQMPLFGTEV
ncbi:hypothetical protein Btru_045373, partial [Bulinus truncatus]